MKKKVTPRDIIVYTLCISTILMVLVDSTYKLVYVKYNFWLMTGIVTGLLLYIFFIHRVKYAWISTVLLFLVPKPLYIIGFFKTFFSDLKGFIDSVVQNQYIMEKYFSYFNNIVFIVLPILIIILYIIVAVKKQAVVLIILGGALISTYYYIGLDNLLLNCNIFLIASFILYSYNNYSIMWRKWDYQRVKIEKGYYLRIIGTNLLLVLLVCFTINILPTNRAPLSLNWFQNEILDRFENLQIIEDESLSESAYESKFSLSYTGYQQDSRRLGGPIEYDYSLALRVRSKDDIGGMHLRGTIKDLYNGFMWDKSDTNTTKIKDEVQIKEYDLDFKLKEMEIIHEGIRTTTAFNALYPYMLTNTYKYGFIDSDLETYNPRVIRSGRGYSVKFKEYKTDQETLLAKGPDKIGEYGSAYEKYLKLPNGIPSRVYDLADEITDKYSSPYMKASAIENYLKTNYPYSRDTSILPEGRDFVDYFLFDEQKGSCSYYATALAVMARMVDIPARYVEGFVVPYSQGSDGYREVLNADAHAWVELYFEGVGWVTFDPTPGGNSSAYQFPEDNENNNDTSSENVGGNDNSSIDGDDRNPDERDPEDMEGLAGSAGRKTSWKGILPYVFLGILGFGILLFAASILAYILLNLFIQRNKRIIQLSRNKMLLYGKMTYIPSTGGETLREYLQLLASRLQVNLDNYILIYEKALYAKHSITPEEQTEILNTMLSVKEKVMERVGKVRFYSSDYINTFQFYIRNMKKGKK